jgi:hypothetical protein
MSPSSSGFVNHTVSIFRDFKDEEVCFSKKNIGSDTRNYSVPQILIKRDSYLFIEDIKESKINIAWNGMSDGSEIVIGRGFGRTQSDPSIRAVRMSKYT